MRLAIAASLVLSVVRSATADIITFENTIEGVSGTCGPWEESADISVPFTLSGTLQFPIVPILGDEQGWGGPAIFSAFINDVDVTNQMPGIRIAYNAEPQPRKVTIGANFQGGTTVGQHGFAWHFDGTLESFPPELDLETDSFFMTFFHFAKNPDLGVLEDCMFDGHATRFDLIQTGDANFDGLFNTSDLIQVFQAGEYENDIVTDSTWETGDWTGDGEFDSQDLTVALQRGTFGGTAGAAPMPVPEPECLFLLALGIMYFKSQSNRRCL